MNDLTSPVTKQFKVIRISTNTNSFGLRHAILVARDGEAFEAHPSAYGSHPLELDQEVCVPTRDGKAVLSGLSWEMCCHLPPVTPGLAAKVWGWASS